MMLRSTIYLFIAFVLSSCAGNPIKTKVGHSITPEFVFLTNVQQLANVGDIMTSSAPLPLHKQIYVDSDVSVSTPHRNKVFNIFAKPGVYTLVAEDTEGLFYEANGDLVAVDDRNVVGGHYINKNDSTKLSLYWHWQNSLKNSSKGVAYIADLHKVPNYEETETISGFNFNGFVSTLTYGGIARGRIMFVYREFSNGLARDAFTQEVYLDYEPESVYAYKSARFVVHVADNTMISYTLLSPL